MDQLDVEKFGKKQKTFHKSISDHLQKLSLHFEGKSKLSDAELALAISNSGDLQSAIKDYYNVLGKVAKDADKKFSTNLDLAGRTEVFEDKERQLQEAIALHLIRQGHFDYADLLCQEAGIRLPEGLADQFRKMFHVLASIKQRNLDPPLNWCNEHRAALENNDSYLEFQLVQLQFVSLLADLSLSAADRSRRALVYAHKNFGRFTERNLSELQKLMGCLAYLNPSPFYKASSDKTSLAVNPLLTSPYAHLFSNDQWLDIENAFIRDFCLVLGLSQESQLKISLDVGAPAMPTMIKLRSLMDDRRKERPKVEMWSNEDELAVEIPLLKKYRYHSIFACPVSREQTSATNPPMMLVCGHIISKESLLRLCKGGKPVSANAAASINVTGVTGPSGVAVATGSIGGPSSATVASPTDSQQPSPTTTADQLQGVSPTAKIKCPYCPSESLAVQSIVVHF